MQHNIILDANKGNDVTVSIPQAVGAVATIIIDANKNSDVDVSIPQAVGAVATRHCEGSDLFYTMSVSIPQAVGAVATLEYVSNKA